MKGLSVFSLGVCGFLFLSGPAFGDQFFDAEVQRMTSEELYFLNGEGEDYSEEGALSTAVSAEEDSDCAGCKGNGYSEVTLQYSLPSFEVSYVCGNKASKAKAVGSIIKKVEELRNSPYSPLKAEDLCDQSKGCAELGGKCLPDSLLSHRDDGVDLGHSWPLSCKYSLSTFGETAKIRAGSCICAKELQNGELEQLIPSN